MESTILSCIEKLKTGDFRDELLTASVNQIKIGWMEFLESNPDRTDMMSGPFSSGLDYSHLSTKFERISTITKEDVKRVAKSLLNENFVSVYKIEGKENSPEIEVPEITPLSYNDTNHSDFFYELCSMETEQPEPVFVDFEKDIKEVKLSTGQTLVYHHNKINQTSYLSFISNFGEDEAKDLNVVELYVPELGSSNMSCDERNLRLYSLASTVTPFQNRNNSGIIVKGLDENLKESLDIASDWILNIVHNEAVLQKLIPYIEYSLRENSKTFEGMISGLEAYLLHHGEDYLEKMTITPEYLHSLNVDTLKKSLEKVARTCSRIKYNGPADIDTVVKLVENSGLGQAYCGIECKEFEYSSNRTTKPEVYLMDYDSDSSRVDIYTDTGEDYNVSYEARILILNEYLDDIMMNEVRESRSLAYWVNGRYTIPSENGETYNFTVETITQNSKITEYLKLVTDLCRNLPASETIFQKAKNTVLSAIRLRRRLGKDAIAFYLNEKKHNLDHDHMSDVYKEVQDITLEDILEFHKEKISGRTYWYSVVGRLSDLDMDYMKTLGEVKIVTRMDTKGFE